MKLLADRTAGKDNNLNLLRLLASWAVLLSHAWPLSRGAGTAQPLEGLTGWTLGEVAVWMFFLLSGMLITGSWERRPHAAQFLRARTLRLLPGLLVSLALVAFVLGPVVTTLPLPEYFQSQGTWTFLLRNSSLALPLYTLPGVFEQNPYPTVEGSIWTLWHEVVCNIGVLGAGLAGLLRRRTVVLALVMAYALAFSWIDREHGALLHPRLDQTFRLAMPFALGVLAWLYRERVLLSAPVSAVLSLAAWGMHST